MSTNFSHLGPENPLAFHMEYLAKSFCLCGILRETDDYTLSIDGGEIFVIHARCGKRLHESTINTIDMKPIPVSMKFTVEDEVGISVVTLKERDDTALAG